MPNLCQVSDVAAVLGSNQPVAGVGDGTKILAMYAALIPGASAAFLNLTNRKTIAQATFTETRSGNGTSSIILRAFPVVSVQSLSIGGNAWNAYDPVNNPNGYAVDDDGYTLELVNGIYDTGIRNIAISYTAGYATIPADIVQAVVEMVLWKKAKMPRIDTVSESLNAMETTSYDRSSIPAFARDTAAQYMDLGGFR